MLQVTLEVNTAISFCLFLFHLCRDIGNWEKHTRGIGAKLLEKVKVLNAKPFIKLISLQVFWIICSFLFDTELSLEEFWQEPRFYEEGPGECIPNCITVTTRMSSAEGQQCMVLSV